jgi:hypothetical protein
LQTKRLDITKTLSKEATVSIIAFRKPEEKISNIAMATNTPTIKAKILKKLEDTSFFINSFWVLNRFFLTLNLASLKKIV